MSRSRIVLPLAIVFTSSMLTMGLVGAWIHSVPLVVAALVMWTANASIAWIDLGRRA